MAAVSYFLKLDGIAGESADAKHPGEIELQAFSFGESFVQAPVTAGGAGAGKVQIEDMHVSMPLSKASPLLFVACASGQHLKSAVLSARRSAGKAPFDFLVITLTDVLVSGYHTGGGTDTGPFDQVTLNFGKIQIQYRAQKPDGTPDAPVTGGWDVKKNVKA